MGGGVPGLRRRVDVDALRGVRKEILRRREAKAQAQHLAHQGAYHTHEDSAVLRTQEDARHHPQRRGGLAEQDAGLVRRRGEAVQRHLPANYKQPAERYIQPCRQVLRTGKEPRHPDHQDRRAEGLGDEVLDEGAVPYVQRGGDGQAGKLLRVRDPLLVRLEGRRAPRPRTERHRPWKVPHPRHQELPADPEEGRHHLAQDAQIEERCGHAGVPRRRARRSPRINPRGAARLPHLLLYQKLPAPRDEARMRRVRSRADSDSRPPSQPRIASHRDGLQPACHSGPAGTRDLRDDASLRPPLPQQAVGYGGGARPGKEALMSRPIVDYKGRRRSKTIAFRVSPEEDEVINALVAASGMTKQDYITSRLERRDITVRPNVRVYRMLRDQMRSVYVELRRLRSADGIDERLIELMQVLTRAFIDLGADELGAVGDDVVQQDAAVLRMARD